MVASERVLANISFPFDLIILSNPQEPFNNMAMDMEVDTPRGQLSYAKSTHLENTSPW